MVKLQRIVKPKTRSGKKYLEKLEPKLKENDKQTMFVKGKNTSKDVQDCLRDMFALKTSLSSRYNRKNDILPFEDATSLEFFSSKSDASLFVFGNHTKKRPNNLILGRLFDGHILDMIELGIEKYTPLEDFKTVAIPFDTKPCLVFAGEAFDEDIEHKSLKNLLIDMFRGPKAKFIRLSGLEHVMSFTAADGHIFMNSYRILMKKSGQRTPRVELEETGPAADFVIRRTQLPSEDLFKHSRRQPKASVTGKKTRKNVSIDTFGTKSAQIHMERQDLDKLTTRKVKAFKRHLDQSNDGGEKKSRSDNENDES